MKNELKFEVTYKGKIYTFPYGSLAYIFHTGIYNGIDRKYGMKTLITYVWKVQDCYLSDSNRTPLGALSDYIAEHWKKLKDASRYDILDKFYEQED